MSLDMFPDPLIDCILRRGDSLARSPIIYFDMDGVLADFDKAAEAVLGVSGHKFAFTHGDAEFWRRVDAVPDFFLGFDLMPGARALWNATKGRQRAILTALPKTGADNVARQKRGWVASYLGPEVTVITCLTKEKPNYCRPGDILIDDRNVNLAAWEAAGGIFIHHERVTDTLIRLGQLGLVKS
jgi:5'(3')-deoxyribonucleotidase